MIDESKDWNEAVAIGGNPREAADAAWSPNHRSAPKAATEGAAVLDSVYAFLGRFVAYPSEHARVAHTLWIAHTHAMDAWNSTPRIGFISAETKSGKTRALEISELLVPRPTLAVNVSAAFLFRKVGDPNGAPTILYDEIDTVFGPAVKKDNEDIRGLLNAGHRRGAVAGRCVVQGKRIETEEIPAYCAVALAGIGELPDTIQNRSIIVRMKRRAPSEPVQPYRRRQHGPDGETLRSRLELWIAPLSSELADAWPAMPKEVVDRDADCWEPLLAVADAAGGDWPDRARVAAVTLVTLAQEAKPSLGIRLLDDLRTVFADASAMRTADILADLHSLPESPWKEIKGKPLDDRGLARRLEKYQISPKAIRFGETTGRGYARADLHDAWVRYLGSASPMNVTSVTSVTCVTCADDEASRN